MSIRWKSKTRRLRDVLCRIEVFSTLTALSIAKPPLFVKVGGGSGQRAEIARRPDAFLGLVSFDG